MKYLIGLIVLLAVASTQATELKIQKVKTIGDFNHKVLFQSTDVKFVKKSNIVTGKIVAQWGVHVYEVADAFYICSSKKVCKLSSYDTVAMYESCKVKNKKAVCFNKISGPKEISDTRDFIVTENPDYVEYEFDNSSDYNYGLEFPARIVDEFSDLF
jgi:hypothetical protein